MFSKELSSTPVPLSSGRFGCFFSSMAIQPGGGGGDDSDMSSPFWQIAPPLGLPHQEIHVLRLAAKFLPKWEIFTRFDDTDDCWHLQAYLPNWAPFSGSAYKTARAHPILTAALWAGRYHHSHFTDEQMEAQRGQVMWPESHSCSVTKWGFETRLSGSSFKPHSQIPIAALSFSCTH